MPNFHVEGNFENFADIFNILINLFCKAVKASLKTVAFMLLKPDDLVTSNIRKKVFIKEGSLSFSTLELFSVSVKRLMILVFLCGKPSRMLLQNLLGLMFEFE